MKITVIYAFNRMCTFLFELLYKPLSVFGPFWSLTLLSLLTGIFMLWIYGKVSNQIAIKQVKEKIHANLIAVRLFKEDLGVFFLIQGRILCNTLRYMKYSFLPMLVMLVPVLLIIIQLHEHYTVRPLAIGEQALVKVKVTDAELLLNPDNIVLENSSGFAVETPGVRIPSEREIAWRICGKEAGSYTMNIRVGTQRVTKELRIGEDSKVISALRTGRSLWEMILYPSEAPLDSSTGIEAIEIMYPALNITFCGWTMNWLVLFFVMSIVFGYAFKGIFGVQL